MLKNTPPRFDVSSMILVVVAQSIVEINMALKIFSKVKCNTAGAWLHEILLDVVGA